MQDYGKRLKQARTNKGYTQAEIANKLSIPQQTWQRYETGKFDLKMSTIYNICNALDISVDWLLGLFEHENIDAVTQFYSKIIDLMDDYNAEGLIPDNKIDEVINDINEIYACYQEP